MRQVLSLLLVSILIVLIGRVSSVGQEITEQDDAAAMKERVLKAPLGTVIRVTLQDGKTVTGRLSEATDEYFALKDMGVNSFIYFYKLASLEILSENSGSQLTEAPEKEQKSWSKFPESKRLRILDTAQNLRPDGFAEVLQNAEAGDAEAQLIVGLAYQDGFGVEKNEAEAVVWYEKAAEQGHPMAQCNLACSYSHGEGVKSNYKEAASWYLKAAEQGFWPAEFNLSYMYDKGLGIRKDDEQSERWLRKAAEAGFAPAQHRVAMAIWESSNKFITDPRVARKEAALWFRRASAQEYVVATYCLGEMYSTAPYGWEWLIDISAAMGQWKEAAAQGYPYAAFRMGEILSANRLALGPPYHKIGDEVSACVWFQIAHELDLRGHWAGYPTKKQAVEFRKDLDKKLSKHRKEPGESFTECESRATRWLQQNESEAQVNGKSASKKLSRGCRRAEPLKSN